MGDTKYVPVPVSGGLSPWTRRLGAAAIALVLVSVPAARAEEAPEPAPSARARTVEYRFTESAVEVLERDAASGELAVVATKALSGGLRALASYRDRLYVARGWSGVAVLDVRVPRSPALVNNLSVGGFASGLELRGAQLIVQVGQDRDHELSVDLRSDHPAVTLPPARPPYRGPFRDYGRVHPTLLAGIIVTTIGVVSWIPIIAVEARARSMSSCSGYPCSMDHAMGLLITGTVSASFILPGVGMMLVGGIKQDQDPRPPRNQVPETTP